MSLQNALDQLSRLIGDMPETSRLRQENEEFINEVRRERLDSNPCKFKLKCGNCFIISSKAISCLSANESLVLTSDDETEDFDRSNNLVINDEGDLRHNQKENFTCPICRAAFPNNLLFAWHSLSHMNVVDEAYESESNHLRLLPVTAFSGLVRDYELTSDVAVTDIPLWLRAQEPLLEQAFSPLIRQFVVRAMFYVRVNFIKFDYESGAVVDRMSSYLPSQNSSQIVDLNEWYESHIRSFHATLNKFTASDGSAWVVENVEHVIFKVTLSPNLNGCGKFNLPKSLEKLKAVINVECPSSCFKYAILSVLHYNEIKKDRQRVSKYKAWENEINFEGVNDDCIDIARDIAKVEKQNNIKINVHVWEKGLQGLRYNSRKNLAPRTVNLLLVTNAEGDRHYCGIISLSRLYRHTKNTCARHHMCERCIRSFQTKEALQTHFEWCVRGKAQIETMPKNKEFSYTTFGHELSPLRVLYADAECYIEPETQAHLPAAVGCYEVWHSHHHNYQKQMKVTTWEGEDCIENFLTKLDLMVRDQYDQSNLTRRPMYLSTSDHQAFIRCQTCPRCHEGFSDSNKKVRDHCHISGEYRGPLCHKCNSRLRLKRNVLPVVFHNLKNYDAHLIIKNGIGKMKGWVLSVIAQSKEKFMSIRAKVPVGKNKTGKTIYFDIVFVDSFQFMPSSLATLANNLQNHPLTKTLKEEYPNLDDNVMRRKGVFPYAYFDSLDKLSESFLPPRSEFKNDLTKEECSEEDYQHAHEAWNLFNCKTFGDYMRAYLKLDIVLLADVFEEFRKLALQQDGLDPVHFVSLPGFSYMSAFKMTGDTIHLLQDADLYSLFERGIRGGLTFVNKHYAVSSCDGDSHKIILYIDENNLYGMAMQQLLPHSNFEELEAEERASLFPNAESILTLNDDDEKGYLFEVDLGYPPNIHNKTKDFPLAPESSEVTEEMLSPFMKTLLEEINKDRHSNTSFKSCRKLLLTQYDREHYIVHFVILKFYLQMGLELKKVHRVVRFTQKRFLKPYIEFNSKQRAQAKNNFEKDFYKLKNNSLFGKTMEDVRKRQNYKLVTDENKMQKLASSPLFLDRDIITEDIVGVKMAKSKVVLDKPIYIGQAVLDYSKLTMYKLFYETLPQCPLIQKLELLGGDTDSFFLEITTEAHVTGADILENLKEHVDFSNYPTDHPQFSTQNKARLGCFKDECAGKEIQEIVLLKPKMYSIKLKDSDKGIKRAKGVSRANVKNMRHETYRNVYMDSKETYVNMTILKSTEHTVHTTTFKKRALSCLEDKRCWLEPNTSLPHGHVDSPVPPPKRRRILPPPRGDVED